MAPTLHVLYDAESSRYTSEYLASERRCGVVDAPRFHAVFRAVQVPLDNMWITISSGVLSFSFIFGNTMSNQLQAILLLFVVHPFDVGDRLLLSGDLVTVEELSLNKVPLTLSTVPRS